VRPPQALEQKLGNEDERVVAQQQQADDLLYDKVSCIASHLPTTWS
jgi:hypothetical protein